MEVVTWNGNLSSTNHRKEGSISFTTMEWNLSGTNHRKEGRNKGSRFSVEGTNTNVVIASKIKI
jgi:hypothetical protein